MLSSTAMWPDICLRKFTLCGKTGGGQNGSETSEATILGEQERVQNLRLDQSLAMGTERVDGLETIRRRTG